MNDHWDRISESATWVDPGRELHLPTVVEDVCRALIDLNAALREAKADAWDEGKTAGLRQSDWEHGDTAEMYVATNPYRKEARDV